MTRRIVYPLALAAALLSLPAAANTYGGAERDEPLARFEDPLCPGIVGVAQDSAVTMVGLIRQNAAELGLRLADPEGCEPNLLVLVIDDPRGYLAGLRERKPYLFDDLGDAELATLFDRPGPAHTWTRVLVRSRDGLDVWPTRSLQDIPWTAMHAAHSLIYVPTRRDIDTALVLIDRKAVQGMSVVQIADYATMAGLSGNQAERLSDPGETIRNLFDVDPAARPKSLTRSDRVFLKTLYSTMPNIPAAITLSMANERIAQGKE